MLFSPLLYSAFSFCLVLACFYCIRQRCLSDYLVTRHLFIYGFSLGKVIGLTYLFFFMFFPSCFMLTFECLSSWEESSFFTFHNIANPFPRRYLAMTVLHENYFSNLWRVINGYLLKKLSIFSFFLYFFNYLFNIFFV